MASDDTVLSRVRSMSGMTNDAKYSEDFIRSEIQAGKDELNREIKNRVNNGKSINLYDEKSAVKALEHFVTLRLLAQKKGRKRPRGFGNARSGRFDDPELAEQASKANNHMRKVFE